MKKFPFKSATFNPLDFLDKGSPLALDDCMGIAQALVVRTGDEKDGAHWLDGAEEFISAVAGVVVQYGTPGKRSLQEVADILASPAKLELAIKLAIESPAWEGMLARMGGKLLHFVDKERSSVLTTCGRFLRFLNTPAMAAATRSSSFAPGLKQRKQTVYLVLPPERIKPAVGWLRLMVGSQIRAVVREGLGEGRKVHFVLDEAASLGMLDAVEDLVDKYRGYGCRAQFYYQSAGQLAKCWPKDQGTTLLSNTSQIYFSVRDLQTANQVSSMLGKETIVVESGGGGRSGGSNTGWSEGAGNSSRSGGSNTGWSTNENWQQAPRELLKPEEVLTLPPRLAITFPGGGVPPVATTLVPHFQEPGLFKPLGWLSRLRAACGTLARSAVLLALSAGAAALLTGAVIDRHSQPYEPQPYQQQSQPPLVPGPARAPVPRPQPAPVPIPPAWKRGAPNH
jgi:type IV secretion system protein VirD4